MKIPLTTYLPDEIAGTLQSWGEKKFRGLQIFSWIHEKQATSFDEMTDLPLELRVLLGERTEIDRLRVVRETSSADGSTNKFLFRLPDGKNVESVCMIEWERYTICVSTQVGCALGCTFCATAKMGWMRNLDAGEIVEQVLNIHRIRNDRASNIVFMGMGEPFLNYDNTIKAARILSHQKGLSIAARRITISTAGIIPGIERFTLDGYSFRLAISFNAPHQDVRTRIMPINKKYTLAKLVDAARKYSETANKPLTFEYVLINGVNDSPDDALRMLSLIKGIRCKINLIPYNSTGNEFTRPSAERIDKFFRTLRGGHRVVNLRWSKGEEVKAACGQLFTEAV